MLPQYIYDLSSRVQGNCIFSGLRYPLAFGRCTLVPCFNLRSNHLKPLDILYINSHSELLTALRAFGSFVCDAPDIVPFIHCYIFNECELQCVRIVCTPIKVPAFIPWESDPSEHDYMIYVFSALGDWGY